MIHSANPIKQEIRPKEAQACLEQNKKMICFNGGMEKLEKIAGQFVTVIIFMSIVAYAFLIDWLLPTAQWYLK